MGLLIRKIIIFWCESSILLAYLNELRPSRLGFPPKSFIRHKCLKNEMPTCPRFLLLTVVVEDNFAQIYIIWSMSHLAFAPISSLMNTGKKLKQFRKLYYVDTKIQNTIQKLQHQVLQCPVIKQFCFSLLASKCSLVSEWVTEENPRFSVWFHSWSLNSYDNASFPLFHATKYKNIAFFRLFAKYSAFASWGSSWELILFQTTTTAQKFLVNQKCFFAKM